jgi:orotate phosphoribosyltransferase
MEAELLQLLPLRRGHFLLESGHHGSLWLDLDSLFLRPSLLQPHVRDLARRLSRYRIDAVIGPLVGGAFLAQTIATELEAQFAFAERIQEAGGVAYRIPGGLQRALDGKRVALVDDAINAGSATHATFTALRAIGAQPVVMAALLQLGDAADAFLAEHGLPIERVAFLANEIWRPADCPLCRAGEPLSSPQASP